MDSQSITTRSELKCVLCDEKAEPKALSLTLLEEITNGFSEEHEIGRGGFAVVYKGTVDNMATVAVKRLSDSYMYYEEQFHREIECLIKVRHKNVVRFIGYCANSQGKAGSYNGKFVMADVQQRLLCFEYLTHGTLDKYITDASCGLNWRTRFKIINEICNGLHYLHQNRIVHLDLKPPNILLDGNMLPKITDFGLSRCFAEKQSHAITTRIAVTMGYSAPELFSREITYRSDLYSLGVIIKEMLTGKCGPEAVEDVLESWSNRLEIQHKDIQLEQIRVCTLIGTECRDFNPAKRPASMEHIIARLHQTGNTEGSIETVVTKSSALQDFSLSGPPIFVPTRILSGHVLLLALTKVRSISADETIGWIFTKLSEKVTNLKDLPLKVDQIRMQLSIMSNVIKMIGTVYLMDELVRSWIGEVRNVAYHVEDVMDKYSYHVHQLKEEGFLKKFFVKGTHYAKVFIEITDEVVQVEKEIQLVIQMKDQWLQPSQLVANPLTEMERQQSQDKFPGFVKDEDLVGIEENRILLTGWLYSEETDSTVITVSGMGGLGKSTLVSNVYEREKINFSAHAWIPVSQIYNVEALLRKILWQIGYNEQSSSARSGKMDFYDLQEEIMQRLENRKCLIVLDDVWEQEVYFQIHSALPNLQGSCIIITTRKDSVAGLSSTTRHHLELQPISKPDAFDLFCRKAFYNQKGHTCPKDLEMIANAIVDRCHGLPLAIVRMGSMLSSRQGLDIWTQKYNQLQSELSNDRHVRSILNLSYHDLSDDLQICLLYCTLFPKDHPLSRESLVRLWVAEGFVLSKEKNTPEMVAEGNLMELIHRNMLEVVENDELGRVATCKMHDIVRELAISIAKEERFASANNYGTMIYIDRDVRRLSLCGWKDGTELKAELPHLRTIVAVGVISCYPAMLSSILSESKYLTVLELQDSEVTEVPASIGCLFNLRYIGLRRTKVKSLPNCIENLSYLQTLDIKQTKIEKLPRGIVKIKKLRHLLADRYDDELQREFPCFIGVQAPENLSSLEELQTLETEFQQ